MTDDGQYFAVNVCLYAEALPQQFLRLENIFLMAFN